MTHSLHSRLVWEIGLRAERQQRCLQPGGWEGGSSLPPQRPPVAA